eukprot:NODE_4303_length_1191_cov_35.690075_g3798_i0.p1 GENE.NODE_4303_length_1191_cov_35.690075_g3798_i0~~NODE_4303_length_1191_cov_35.690075_g3798_i0.p1  ORF type:complete len:382 (+),score=66.43 NODE_4303_length_1191_cov_35.690075_g3798_i0:43-1146(+)
MRWTWTVIFILFWITLCGLFLNFQYFSQSNQVQLLNQIFNQDFNVQEFANQLNKLPSNIIQSAGKRCSAQDRCDIAVCTAIFMEDPYLEEWLIYHLLMGIQHFFLVQMTSSSGASLKSQTATYTLLKPFIDRGQVTIIYIRGIYDSPQVLEQIHAMRFCIQRFIKRSKWMINLDVDEYAEKNNVQSLPLAWYMFGSSGYESRPPLLTIEAYHRRSKFLVHDPKTTTYFARKNGKYIFKTKCYQELMSPHELVIVDGCIMGRYSAKYHLKHYHVKSYDDWMWKRYSTGFTGFRTNETRYDGQSPGFWNSANRYWKKDWKYSDSLMNDTDDFDLDIYKPIMKKLASNLNPVWRWCQTVKKGMWLPKSCF